MNFSVNKWCVLAVLTALLFMGVHGRATPALPPSNNKVIIYPAATDTIDQLTQKGITRVSNYGSYWLVQATDAQVDVLTRMYGTRAVKANDLNHIRLRNISIDTTEGDPTVPSELRQVAPSGKRLRLIQFRGPVMPQWLRQIQSVSGVELLTYVPNNAYLVRLDQPAENKLQVLVGPNGPIQWMGAYHPYYKIQPGLADSGEARNSSPVELAVMVAPHSEASETMKAIEKMGFVEYSYNRANLTTLDVTAPISVITKLAKLPDVVWIEKRYPKRLLDEVQDLTLAGQTNGLEHGPEGATIGFTNYLDFLFTQVAGTQTNTFVDSTTYPVVDVADTGIDSGPLGGTVIYGTNGTSILGLSGTFTVEPPVHPAFHYLGDARFFSRVVYDGPQWVGGDPAEQLGCPSVYIGPNDGPFKHIESVDLVGHGTAVASIIAGFDDGTNILNQPCLQLVSASNTWLVAIPGSSAVNTNTLETIAITNNLRDCGALDSGIVASTNLLFQIPMGFSETCGTNGTPPNATFTNVLITLTGTNSCPTNIYVDVLYTAIITNNFSQIRVDDDGNQIGMGVSPFGLLGNSRIWQNYASDLSISGTAPGTGIFGLSTVTVGGGCNEADFKVELNNCVTDFVSLMGIIYDEGARIQNNSWSDNIGIPPTNGGPYTADCVTFDTGVRDASLTGSSNNIPGPSPLNQEFIVVFACASSLTDAGDNIGSGGFNDIFITAPATAKNIISVGVSDNPRFATITNRVSCDLGGDSQDMPSYAANGPTLDGRFKPEIVAPGAGVFAAISQIVAVTTNCSLDKTLFPSYPFIVACTNPPCDGSQGPIYTELYGCVEGSSYAAPAVSGAIQLLWWYFQNRLTNELGQALYQPSPAMAKAYVCNAARYLPIGDPRNTNTLDTLPSTLQGMGALDLGRMFDGVPRAIRDESSPRAINVVLTTTNPAPQQTYFSQSGQTYTLSGQIATNNQPFRVTLAWIDPPGSPAATLQLVNNLDLQVTLGTGANAVVYKGNWFAENVSASNGVFDTVNNMESVFLNPTSMLNGIPGVTSGAPFQVTVRATDVAGQGVPNVGEPIPGGSNTLNQDFALVVYNAATNTLSDVPNLTTNNDCSTAMNLSQFPFVFTNTLTSATYHHPFPNPSAGTGGPEEFFRISQPTPEATLTVSTTNSSFGTILSVWEVQVLPSTIAVRGECGYLTEIASTDQPQLSFTSDGSNDYYVVVQPAGNGSGGTLVLNVNATTVPITITPPNLAFGNQIAGTTGTPQVVTYANGTTVASSIENVAITGSNAADFAIVSDGCSGGQIPPGGNCIVSVALSPATNDIGLLQANLTFTDNQLGSPRSIPLTGTGTAPVPSVCLSTGTPIEFSSQVIGTTSAVQSVTITNCGSLPLTVSNITFSGTAASDFLDVQDCANAPIPEGGTCTIQVSFAPTKSGSRLATLVIPNSAAGSPATVSVQGIGVAPAPSLCVSSSTIDFGNTAVTSTSAIQSLTITNCGTAPLVISNVALTAGETGDFVIVSDPCTAGSISTGGTCVVSLQFVPTSGGARTATLSISNNAGSPELVTLVGAGAMSQPDAAIGKNTNMKKAVGFGVINTTGVGQEVSQNVHLETPEAISKGKGGISFYVNVKNLGAGPDMFLVQGQQIDGGQGFTANYFLGSKPSESVDVTAAVEAGSFATSTMAAGAETSDSTLIRVVIYADKTVVVGKGTTATFTLTFTSASDSTKQDTVRATVVAK